MMVFHGLRLLLLLLLVDFDHHSQRGKNALAMWAPPELKIGAFNPQIFGEKKANSEGIVEFISQLICKYDVIALLEFRSVSLNPLSHLIDHLMRTCKHRFGYRINARDGSSSTKEQIIFFYKISTIEVVDTYSPADSTKFERVPFIGVFKSLQKPNFNFLYMAVHLRPDAVVAELNALSSVYKSAINKFREILSSAFIMGDLNADCDYVRVKDWDEIKLHKNGKVAWLIPTGTKTNTNGERSCAYDRILMDNRFLDSYKDGSAGIYDFYREFPMKEYKLTPQEISDHYPINFVLLAKKLSIKWGDEKMAPETSPPFFNPLGWFGSGTSSPLKRQGQKPEKILDVSERKPRQVVKKQSEEPKLSPLNPPLAGPKRTKNVSKPKLSPPLKSRSVQQPKNIILIKRSIQKPSFCRPNTSYRTQGEEHKDEREEMDTDNDSDYVPEENNEEIADDEVEKDSLRQELKQEIKPQKLTPKSSSAILYPPRKIKNPRRNMEDIAWKPGKEEEEEEDEDENFYL